MYYVICPNASKQRLVEYRLNKVSIQWCAIYKSCSFTLCIFFGKKYTTVKLL